MCVSLLVCSITLYGKCPCVGELSPVTLKWNGSFMTMMFWGVLAVIIIYIVLMCELLFIKTVILARLLQLVTVIKIHIQLYACKLGLQHFIAIIG